jgi:transposase-like protein
MNPTKRDESRRNQTISARQERVALALAGGRTVAAASRECRVHASTIWAWLKQPEFRSRIAELRQQWLDTAIGRLGELLGQEALDTLKQLLRARSDGIKLESVKAAFELYTGIVNSTELQARIAQLEASQPKGKR